MLRLGFITAIREDIDLPDESFFKRVMANLGPMYLASYLEKSGLAVEVIIKDRIEDLAPYAPEMLGISSVTENIEFAKVLAQKAKDLWNPVVLLGGSHITALPQSLAPIFDVGVIGEGEETITELVGVFLKEPRRFSGELKKVAGIAYWDKGALVRTPVRKGLARLDDIPPPNRKKYIKQAGITYMMTSRGCPYTCDFCSIPVISDGYRKHSPEYVVEELKMIRAGFKDARHIRIFDDLFTVDKKRVLEIAARVHAEGLHRDLNFSCWVRANLLDEEILESFGKMNMFAVAFGAESGSSRVLSQIKPGCTLEQNQSAVDRLHDHGIMSGFSVILGHPLETEDDLWATYAFIEKNLEKTHEIEMNVAIPWPGTDLWVYAKDRGIVRDDMDFNVLKECSRLSNYSTDRYPYLNERIPLARFDEIISEFKKLYRKMTDRNRCSGIFHLVNPSQEIAAHF